MTAEPKDPNEIASLTALCRETGCPMRPARQAIALGELEVYAFPYARPYVRRSKFLAWLESCRDDAAKFPSAAGGAS